MNLTIEKGRFSFFFYSYGLCGIHYIDAGYLGFKAYFTAPRKGTVWVSPSLLNLHYTGKRSLYSPSGGQKEAVVGFLVGWLVLF